MVEGIPTSWLAVLPESLIDSISAFQTIQKGRAQTCFFTLHNGVELFAKQNDSDVINREINALSFLAQYQPLPSFFYPELFNTDGNCLLTVKLEGLPLIDNLSLAIEEQGLVTALAQLHSINVCNFTDSSPKFEYPSISSLRIAFEKFGVQVDIREKLLNRLKAVSVELQEITECLGFNHGDLTADNVLFHEGKSVFLDWEFASIRDVRWDLATVCEEFDLTSAQATQFVKDYIGLRAELGSDFIQGVEYWRFIYLATCFIWSVEQAYKSEEYLNKLVRTLDDN